MTRVVDGRLNFEIGLCEFRAAFGRLFLLRDFNSPYPGLALKLNSDT